MSDELTFSSIGPAGIVEPDGPDMDAPGSLFTDPCPQCGSLGACGYDAEGRPMIHVAAYCEDEAKS